MYRARDTRLSRTVAIKVLPADAAGDAAARARFEREARAIATLSHPHICVVHDVGHQDGVDYLVMELLEGETLAQRIARAGGPLPLPEVLSIGAAIADALDRAHRAGIVHRDLKPLNVMLTKSGPKLLDFGLAKRHAGVGWSQAGETTATTAVGVPPGVPGSPASPGAPSTLAHERLTGEGTIVGSLHYMSPEQVEGHEADPRSDIWALGAVLYEMATGQRPFEGESPASVVGAILKDTPAPVSSRLPLSPPLFDRIVQKCLAKSADARWQSASDLRDELEWVQRTPSVTGPRPSGERAEKRPTTTRLGVIAALVATAAVAFAVGSFFDPRSQAAPSPVWLSIAPPAGPFGPRLGPAVSPDGSTIAFWAPDTDGVFKLWVRELSKQQARALPGTDGPLETTGSRTPTWSPDGRSLAYFSRGKLQRIDVAGGNPTVLADAGGAPRGLTWGAAGTIVFVPNSGGGLFVIPASGGTAKPLDVGDLSRAAEWPSFLPDGHRFLFVFSPEQVPEDARLGVYVGSTGPEAVVRVSDVRARAQYATGHLFFVQGDVLYAQGFDLAALKAAGEPIRVAEGVGSMGGDQLAFSFSVAENGTITFSNSPFVAPSQLQVLDRQGHTVRTLGEVGPIFGLAMSVDAKRLLYEHPPEQKVRTTVWSIDPASGVSALLLRDASTPVLSGDGERVAFRRSGNTLGIAPVANVSRSADIPAAGLPGRPWLEDLSPDGRSLLVRVDVSSTQIDLWTLAVDGAVAASPFMRTPANESQGRFSPDGRWVAYTSDESGRDEVYVQAYPGPGIKTRVSSAGGTRPAWRADGKELYYFEAAQRLMVTNVQSSAQRFQATPARALFEIPGLGSAGPFRTQYAPIGKGDQFLVNMMVPSKAPTTITVLLNWRPAAGQ